VCAPTAAHQSGSDWDDWDDWDEEEDDNQESNEMLIEFGRFLRDLRDRVDMRWRSISSVCTPDSDQTPDSSTPPRNATGPAGSGFFCAVLDLLAPRDSQVLLWCVSCRAVLPHSFRVFLSMPCHVPR